MNRILILIKFMIFHSREKGNPPKAKEIEYRLSENRNEEKILSLERGHPFNSFKEMGSLGKFKINVFRFFSIYKSFRPSSLLYPCFFFSLFLSSSSSFLFLFLLFVCSFYGGVCFVYCCTCYVFKCCVGGGSRCSLALSLFNFIIYLFFIITLLFSLKEI